MKTYKEFLKEILEGGDLTGYEEIGELAYFRLRDGVCAKVACVDNGLECRIINSRLGTVDTVKLLFASYFKKKQCSKNAPLWDQHIQNGKWYFSDTYAHVVPDVDDYKSICKALKLYLELYSNMLAEGEEGQA